jgi:hypothetical protein
MPTTARPLPGVSAIALAFVNFTLCVLTISDESIAESGFAVLIRSGDAGLRLFSKPTS